MYIFNSDSDLVKTFILQIQKGESTREQVPSLSNLQEVGWRDLDKLG
ncbi:hypothetical protein M1E11_16730 [Bacillus sp. JZ8]